MFICLAQVSKRDALLRKRMALQSTRNVLLLHVKIRFTCGLPKAVAPDSPGPADWHKGPADRRRSPAVRTPGFPGIQGVLAGALALLAGADNSRMVAADNTRMVPVDNPRMPAVDTLLE
jgi:hypothetical protein